MGSRGENARARGDEFEVNQSIVRQVNRLPLPWAALPNAIHDLYC